MNIRANCCRCLGGLIRCLDGMVIDQADPDAIVHDVEFNTVTVDIIDAIILNISTGKAMKVRFFSQKSSVSFNSSCPETIANDNV